MITPEQNRLNLRTAAREVARTLGHDAGTFDPRSFTYEQRTEYLNRLGAFITARPQLFTAGTLRTAAELAAKNYAPLSDPAPTFDAFADAFIDEAIETGAAVAAVGEGVKTSLTLTQYLLPLALVFAVFIALKNFDKKTAAA